MRWHHHRWVVVEKTEQPSSWEVFTSQLKHFKWGDDANLPADFWTRYFVVQYRCNVCGSEKMERV